MAGAAEGRGRGKAPAFRLIRTPGAGHSGQALIGRVLMASISRFSILQKFRLASKNRANGFFGVLGFAIPSFVTFLAYPFLVHHIGLTAMGVYILGSSVTGTLAMLDLGFSAATLKFVSEDLAAGALAEAAEVVVTSLCFYGGLGVVGGAALWFLSPLFMHTFNVDAALRADGVWSFRIAASQFAFFMLISVFLSIFKAFQRFHLSALCMSGLSVLTFGGGVAAVYWGHVGLIGLTLVSLLSNALIFAFAAFLGLRDCLRSGMPLWHARPEPRTFRRMLKFGSVLTFNSASEILMFQGQRYLAGVLFGPASVTIYQMASMIPYKVHAAVAALNEVLFPFVSANAEPKRIRRVYLRMILASGAIGLAGLVPLVLLRHWILPLWLGADTAGPVAAVLPVFALAAAIHALGCAPYFFAYGVGKPLLNSRYSLSILSMNILILGGLHLTGRLSFVGLCWAFTIAQVLAVIGYHAVLERGLWNELVNARHAAPRPSAAD